MLLCAGAIGALLLLSQGISRMGGPLAKSSGPLSSYVVAPERKSMPSCEAASCTYLVVHPAASQVTLHSPARYVAPPTQLIAAPAGKVFRSTESYEFLWHTSWVFEPGGYMLVRLSGAEDGADGYLPDSGDPVRVPTLGYVRSVKVAGTGEQISLAGIVTKAGVQSPLYAGASGQRRLYKENPAFSEMEFQPFGKRLTLEMADSPGLPIEAGDAATFYFEQTPAPDVPRIAMQVRAAHWRHAGLETPAPDAPGIAMEVVKATRSGSPSVLQLQMDLTDQQAYGVLHERVLLEQNEGLAAFPERMRLALTPRYGRGDGQLLRIPASAIVRRGADVSVWVVIDEFAIPLSLQEFERGENASVVTEKPGARGLPIRPEHWRELSAYARSRVLLAARHLDDAKWNKLLNPFTNVIEQPSDKLKPGSRARILNVNAS